MSTFDERRRARATWPIRTLRLGQEPALDDRDTSTVDERIALVWELTRRQWAFAGLPILGQGRASRAAMPGRIFRRP